jgi:hypothetical protein
MLKHIDGFDQYQGQVSQQLLSSLTSAGFTVSSGLAMVDGRKPGSYALELQVAAGTAGASWSSRTNNTKQDLHGIAANSAGRFVAVGNNGAAVGSDDNITWLPVILGVSSNMRDIDVSGSTWIAVGDQSALLRSTDGKNFTVRPAPVSNAALQSVATNGSSTWVAVGSVGATGAIFVSIDDGMTWESRAIAGINPINLCVAFSGGVWVIGGGNGRILTSTDLSNFTTRVSGTQSQINAVACSDVGHWLLASGSDIRRSVDGGSNWALMSAAISGGQVVSLAYADGRWMAVSSSGEVHMTDDEDSWQAPSLTGIGNTPLYCVYALHGSRSGWAVVGALNVTVTQSTERRAVIYVSLAPPTKVARTYSVPGSKFTVGFAHHSTARGRILSITDVLEMDWPANIEMNNNAGTAIPARNVWYFYEITIDKTALTATLHINDTLDLTCPLDASVGAMDAFEFVWMAENGAVTRIDDIYMVDTSTPGGETLVGRLGPITIPLRLPTADATPNEWIPSSGITHWAQVGLLPPSEESYIRSSTSGKQDLFTSSTALPADAGTVDAPILAVGVIALAMKGDIDNRQLGLAVGAPGPTQKEIVDTALSVVPEYSFAVFEKAPGDVAWDAENTLSTPFGVVVRP